MPQEFIREDILDKEPALPTIKSSVQSPENHLLLLSMPLLGLMVGLKNAEPQQNKENFSAAILQVLNHFNQKAQQSGYSSRIILAAQYCLCTAMDETIMHTSWGRETRWGDQSLLTILYKETFGGERFYIILESMLSNPQENIDLLELIYVLLSLGFKGKFYNKDPLFLEAIRIDLFKKIYMYLNPRTKDYLLESTPQFGKHKNKIVIPLWVIFSVTFLILIFIMLAYDYFLNRASLPIFDFLENLYSQTYYTRERL